MAIKKPAREMGQANTRQSVNSVAVMDRGDAPPGATDECLY